MSHDPYEPELDFQNHLPAGMETFTIRFLSLWFRSSKQHWINLIESGHIAAVDLSTPGKSKSMMRVPRASLVKFLNDKKTL